MWLCQLKLCPRQEPALPAPHMVSDIVYDIVYDISYTKSVDRAINHQCAWVVGRTSMASLRDKPCGTGPFAYQHQGCCYCFHGLGVTDLHLKYDKLDMCIRYCIRYRSFFLRYRGKNLRYRIPILGRSKFKNLAKKRYRRWQLRYRKKTYDIVHDIVIRY